MIAISIGSLGCFLLYVWTLYLKDKKIQKAIQIGILFGLLMGVVGVVILDIIIKIIGE